MEPNPNKIEDALEATQPEQFETQHPEREDGSPDVNKVDYNQSQTWVRVPGPKHVTDLPKPGDIRIEWNVMITSSEGVIHVSEDAVNKRAIDGPNHAKTVALSIQKVLEGSFYEPMLADVQAYGARRLDAIATRTQTLREAAPVAQLPDFGPASYEQPLMPAPPNPSAKI